ncbi:MAG: hypothetical protein WDN27_06875 [Candidatus Saccharibacteria bacterium]
MERTVCQCSAAAAGSSAAASSARRATVSSGPGKLLGQTQKQAFLTV